MADWEFPKLLRTLWDFLQKHSLYVELQDQCIAIEQSTFCFLLLKKSYLSLRWHIFFWLYATKITKMTKIAMAKCHFHFLIQWLLLKSLFIKIQEYTDVKKSLRAIWEKSQSVKRSSLAPGLIANEVLQRSSIAWTLLQVCILSGSPTHLQSQVGTLSSLSHQ